jgi:hypothetical protein
MAYGMHKEWRQLRAVLTRELLRLSKDPIATLLAPAVPPVLVVLVGTVAWTAPFASLTLTLIVAAAFQSAFAHGSSAFMFARFTGGMPDLLCPPVRYGYIVLGISVVGAGRGLVVFSIAATVWGCAQDIWPAHPVLLAVAIIMGAFAHCAAGCATGLLARDFFSARAISEMVVWPLNVVGGAVLVSGEPAFRTMALFSPLTLLQWSSTSAYGGHGEPVIGLMASGGLAIAAGVAGTWALNRSVT